MEGEEEREEGRGERMRWETGAELWAGCGRVCDGLVRRYCGEMRCLKSTHNAHTHTPKQTHAHPHVCILKKALCLSQRNQMNPQCRNRIDCEGQ